MTIEPISELKNYNSLLSGVKDGEPIYLTKNGKGLYAIITIKDAEEYEKFQINKKFENELKPNVADQDFFVKDVDALNKKLKKAMKEAMNEEKSGKADNEDITVFFNRLRKEIDAGTI